MKKAIRDMPRWFMVLAGFCVIVFGVVFVVYAYTDPYLLPNPPEGGVADELPTGDTAYIIAPDGSNKCYGVTNNIITPGKTIFVPYNNASEWSDFLNQTVKSASFAYYSIPAFPTAPATTTYVAGTYPIGVTLNVKVPPPVLNSNPCGQTPSTPPYNWDGYDWQYEYTGSSCVPSDGKPVNTWISWLNDYTGNWNVTASYSANPPSGGPNCNISVEMRWDDGLGDHSSWGPAMTPVAF
jgi:hypothetical protein